jgi:hypothetical protein
LFKNNKSIINYGVDRMHESLSLSEMAQEKQTCIRDKQIFPSFWTIIQSGTFVISGGCCVAKSVQSASLCWC